MSPLGDRNADNLCKLGLRNRLERIKEDRNNTKVGAEENIGFVY